MKDLIKKIHRFSAFVLVVFIAFHLLNHLAALAGPQSHIDVMTVFRKVYRHPLIEPILLFFVLVQLISGVLLVVTQRFWKSTLTFLQAISGLYLGLFLVNHVRAVLMARFSWHVETDFYFAANVAVDPATRTFFLPYYALAIISIFLHIACAHYSRKLLLNAPKAISNPSYEKRTMREAWIIALSGLVIAALVLASFGGFLYEF